jgi:hypothetical protein
MDYGLKFNAEPEATANILGSAILAPPSSGLAATFSPRGEGTNSRVCL